MVAGVGGVGEWRAQVLLRARVAATGHTARRVCLPWRGDLLQSEWNIHEV